MGIQSVTPTGSGPLTDWSAGVGYIYTATPGDVHEYTFPATAVPTGQMVMAARLLVTAKTTGTGTLKLSLRDGTAATNRRFGLPKETSYTLTASDVEYRITIPNLPFPSLPTTADSWNSTAELNDYAWGVEAIAVGSGEIQVSSVVIELIYRPSTTVESLVTDTHQGGKLMWWQWAEVEGIPYVFSTRQLPGDFGSYYYGVDRKPCADLLVANEQYRSGKVSHSKGREELEGANIKLIDSDEIAHESDANGGAATLAHYPGGFISWLLAYGDRTNINRTLMTDSTGSGLNSIKGLDPKDWSGSYGRKFTVADTSSFPAANLPSDSNVYIGRETVWYGEKSATSFGNNSDTTKLLRGQFGSINQPHEYERFTNIYPEVSDRPTCWSGRWVRLWLAPIDPATGYPFPRSMGICQTYYWGTHEQSLAPSSAGYTIRLRPFEDSLKAVVPSIQEASVRYINIVGSSVHIAIKEGTAAWLKLPLVQDTFKDINKLCDELNSILSASSVSGTYQFWPNGKKIRIQGRTSTAITSVSIALSHDLSACLGMGSDRDDNGSSPIQVFDSTAFASRYDHVLDGDDEYCETFVSPDTTKIYVKTNDTEDWPSDLGSINGQSEYMCLTVGVGDDEPLVFQFQATPTGTDTNGDYLNVVANQPGAVALFQRQRKRIFTQPGEQPITCAPMLIQDTLELHNVWLRLMSSTGYGTNGAYDIYPKGFGAGIDSRLLDLTGWQATSQALSPGSQYRTYFHMEGDKLEELLGEELKWPSPLMLRQSYSGKLMIERRDPPQIRETYPEITEDHHIKRGRRSVTHPGNANIVNSVTASVDYNPFADNYGIKLIAREPNSIRLYGEKKQDIKHRGVRSSMTPGKGAKTSAPHSFFVAAARELFARWSWEQPQYQVELNGRALILRNGDTVSLTMENIADVLDGSARGVSDRNCEIIKLTRNVVTGKCQATLTHDQLGRRHSGYAPSAEIVSWDSGTNTATVQANSYTSASLSETDAGTFQASWRVLVVEYDSIAPEVWAATILTISGNTIQFTASPGVGDRTPAQYDRIIYDDYDAQFEAQKAELYAHVSSSGYIDLSDLVEGYNYAI